MANSFNYKDQSYRIGDTVRLLYQLREGEKTRNQAFSGMVMQVRGRQANKTITVRRLTKFGIGVERIIPLSSPFIVEIVKMKSTSYKRAKINFVRNLSEQKLRQKIYRNK